MIPITNVTCKITGQYRLNVFRLDCIDALCTEDVLLKSRAGAIEYIHEPLQHLLLSDSTESMDYHVKC